MNSGNDLPREEGTFEESPILHDARLRRILTILLEHSQPLTARDLAVQLAVHETDSSPSGVPGDQFQSIQADLRHRCLPKLNATDWIDRRPDGIVVHPSRTDEIQLPTKDIREERFQQLSVVRNRRHRCDVLRLLARESSPVELETLVTELSGRVRPYWPIDDDETSIALTLHHVDLPALAEVGLLRYDPAEKLITPDGSATEECLSLLSEPEDT